MLLNDSDTNILSPEIRTYFSEVHYDIRDEALRDFIKAYTTQLKLVREGKKHHFAMKFRLRKNCIQESIVINHKHLRRNDEGKWSCFPRIWEKEILDTFDEELPESINHDCRLIMTKDNKFYLAVPMDVPVTPKILQYNAISLDPGVRIFQTTYDTMGSSYTIGEDDANGLDKLGRISSRMRAGMKREWINGVATYREAKNKRERKGLKRAANKIEMKIKNKISDIHRKTAKFLCKKYDTVMIPEFKVQQMTKKKENGEWKRKIGKETARKMIRWGHYKFRELLRNKGETNGTNVVIGTEEWTSKTCGNCMWINKELKGEKELICSHCGMKVHRDIGAARNILMLNWERSGLEERKIRLVIKK